MFFFKQLLLVFPGRMALGKLGMWMVRVGEVLQRYCAGQNKTFRMKVEFGENRAEFHISEKVTDEYVISFGSPNSQIGKQPLYVKKLFAILGVYEVLLYPYYIVVKWGKVFSAKEIVPKVEKIVIEAFKK